MFLHFYQVLYVRCNNKFGMQCRPESECGSVLTPGWSRLAPRRPLLPESATAARTLPSVRRVHPRSRMNETTLINVKNLQTQHKLTSKLRLLQAHIFSEMLWFSFLTHISCFLTAKLMFIKESGKIVYLWTLLIIQPTKLKEMNPWTERELPQDRSAEQRIWQ